MADVHLRPYAPADFDALYQIDQACYPPGIAYTRRMLRWFLTQPGAICLLAEAGGEIAGFILAGHGGLEGHIITIDVLEPWRRRGVGTLLLEAIERDLAARSVRRVGLETATTNHAAVAFWQKHGYRTGGVLKNYYLGKLDAYWMRKQLEPLPER